MTLSKNWKKAIFPKYADVIKKLKDYFFPSILIPVETLCQKTTRHFHGTVIQETKFVTSQIVTSR